MNDPFDDELRQSLRSQADQVPRRPDLGRAAITQAKHIRRRRQVAGVVAATALVAIAVPVGLRAGDLASNGQDDPVAPATTGPTMPTAPTEPPTTTPETPPSQGSDPTPSNGNPSPSGNTDEPDEGPSGPVDVALDLRNLSEGEAPSIPYLDGSTVVGDGYEIDISASGTPAGIAPVAGGVYVAGQWTEDGWPLTWYADDGDTEDLGTVQGTPVASSDGRWVAYVTSETDEFGNSRGPASLVLRDENGSQSSVELDGASADGVAVHAIVDGTVYFTYYTHRGRDVPLQTWSAGDAAPKPVSGEYRATAMSSDGNLVARQTSVTDSESCSSVVDLSTGEESEEYCAIYFSIKGFSSDGRFAWGSGAEGYAATSITVLDTQTGRVVRQYESASQRHYISFMDATFEDGDSLLIQAEQDGETALVRCDLVTGDCELAEPLADGTAETGSPYLLPDVG